MFANVTRTSCITDTDPDNKLWCSTKTDHQGVHIGGAGHWGYCSPACSGPIQLSQNFVVESSTCVTSDGGSGQCVPPSGCVGVSHDNIDQDTCTLANGDKGLCCIQNLKNNVVNLGGGGGLPSVSVPDVTSNELDDIFDLVDIEVKKQANVAINTRLSGGIGIRNNRPKIKTPSFFHTKFNSPRKEIIKIDQDSHKLLLATKKLKELKNLTDNQVDFTITK